MKPFSLLLAGPLVVALSACSVDNVASGPTNKSQTGALIGGVLGGLIGASSDDKKFGKGIVGAGIGAAVGGVIGHQLDKQAQELRRDIPNEDITIENTGDELRVTLPDALLFDVDSDFVRPELRADLSALARNLQNYPDTNVVIVGHTDDTGSDAYNFDLSERRAQSVGIILEGQGVAGQRIRSYGEGETQPVASNSTDNGRALNRRVEIVIRPNAA